MTTLESACSWTWKLQLQTTDLPHSSDEFLVTPTSDLAPFPEIITASIPRKVAEVSIVKITIIVKSVVTRSCVEQGDLNQWLTARYLWRFRAISHWHAEQDTRILFPTCIDFANMGKFARKLLSGDEYQIYLRGGSPTPAPTVYVKQTGRPYFQSPDFAPHRISMFYADLHPMNKCSFLIHMAQNKW